MNRRPPRDERPRWRTALFVAASILIAAVVGAPLAARTRAVNRTLDGWAISIMASVARRAPADTTALLPWKDEADLELLTRPPEQRLEVTAAPMTRFQVRDRTVVQEVIAFPSAIKLDHVESNTARAYVYRHGRLGERPVVLWVPGQYAVDALVAPALGFVEQVLHRGADVILFVPPYHFERAPAGFSSGDAVLATSTRDHLRVFAQELSDLRRLTAWLRARGVPALGGFGTSMGGAAILRTVTWDDALDFVTLFVPAVSIGDLLDEPNAAPFLRRLAAEGHSRQELTAIYAALDPTRATPRLDVARISILYGRYDRIARERRILELARAWGVTRLFKYPRGHALALLTPSIYRDYARRLDDDLRALGH